MPNRNKILPVVYADFNNADTQGRLRLNCQGTIEDLERQRIHLQQNLQLMLQMENLQCAGTVVFSDNEGIWVAAIDWPAIKEL